MTQAAREFDHGEAGLALLITATLEGERDARAALDAAGLRVAALDWRGAAARLASQVAVDLIWAELATGGEEAVAEVAAALAPWADGGVAIVLAIDAGQIDAIAALIGTPGLQLLCDAGPAERSAALALARLPAAAPVLNDASRDAEARRLQRLNEEVARIAETLARLTRPAPATRESRSETVADRSLGYGAPPQTGDAAPSATEIRQAIRARRLRDQFFSPGLFEDPAWDMLLDLFAADLERSRVSVSSLCIAAAVAPTTALRWIGRMTEAGLFERQPDPFDRRRAFLGLSATARAGMLAYHAAVKRAGLGIA